MHCTYMPCTYMPGQQTIVLGLDDVVNDSAEPPMMFCGCDLKIKYIVL
jgi:hypothetical protein